MTKRGLQWNNPPIPVFEKGHTCFPGWGTAPKAQTPCEECEATKFLSPEEFDRTFAQRKETV